MRLAWIGLLATVACGRLDFDAPAGVDGSLDNDPVACTGDFEAQTLVSELSGLGDVWAPALTADRRDIVFDIGDGIWEATRATTVEPFGPPTELATLEIGLRRFRPTLSGDGLTVYFTAYFMADNDGQIYTAHRTDRSSPWSTPTLVPVCNTGTTDLFGADVTDDGQEMYLDEFIGVPQNGPMLHALWNATTGRYDCTGIESQVGVGTMLTDYMEVWPSLSGDRLTLYYVVSTGNAAPVDTAIYTAHRSSTAQPLASPTELTWTVVPGAGIDTPAITRDDRELWFASDRAKPGGPRSLYVAARACP